MKKLALFAAIFVSTIFCSLAMIRMADAMIPVGVFLTDGDITNPEQIEVNSRVEEVVAARQALLEAASDTINSSNVVNNAPQASDRKVYIDGNIVTTDERTLDVIHALRRESGGEKITIGDRPVVELDLERFKENGLLNIRKLSNYISSFIKENPTTTIAINTSARIYISLDHTGLVPSLVDAQKDGLISENMELLNFDSHADSQSSGYWSTDNPDDKNWNYWVGSVVTAAMQAGFTSKAIWVVPEFITSEERQFLNTYYRDGLDWAMTRMFSNLLSSSDLLEFLDLKNQLDKIGRGSTGNYGEYAKDLEYEIDPSNCIQYMYMRDNAPVSLRMRRSDLPVTDIPYREIEEEFVLNGSFLNGLPPVAQNDNVFVSLDLDWLGVSEPSLYYPYYADRSVVSLRANEEREELYLQRFINYTQDLIISGNTNAVFITASPDYYYANMSWEEALHQLLVGLL